MTQIAKDLSGLIPVLLALIVPVAKNMEGKLLYKMLNLWSLINVLINILVQMWDTKNLTISLVSLVVLSAYAFGNNP